MTYKAANHVLKDRLFKTRADLPAVKGGDVIRVSSFVVSAYVSSPQMWFTMRSQCRPRVSKTEINPCV